MPLRLAFTLELIALRGGPEWFTEVYVQHDNETRLQSEIADNIYLGGLYHTAPRV